MPLSKQLTSLLLFADAVVVETVAIVVRNTESKTNMIFLPNESILAASFMKGRLLFMRILR